jgi:site-specific DNA-cytosine methylase
MTPEGFRLGKINENLKTRKDSLFFSRDVKYRLAGNSIAVNVLKYIFDQIIDIYEILGMDCENESVG